MLGGFWRIFNTDGKYLGCCHTDPFTPNVLTVLEFSLEMLNPGTLLHLDTVDGSEALNVVILGHGDLKSDQYRYCVNGSREEQYLNWNEE